MNEDGDTFTFTQRIHGVGQLIEELRTVRTGDDVYVPPDSMRCTPDLIEEGQVFL